MTVRTSDGPMVMQPAASMEGGASNILAGRPPAVLANSTQFDPRSNPSEHKLLTPPPNTPPPKIVISSFMG